MTWYVALATLAVGFASGVLAGMFGVGGAVITTPGIRVLGATPIEAVGSTVPAILPGAISGTIRYSRAGMVNWRIGLVCGLTGSALAVVGAWVSDLVNGHLLMVITATLLGVSGVSIARSGRRHLPPEDMSVELEGVSDGEAIGRAVTPSRPDVVTPTQTHVAMPALALVGAVSGFVAGLLGVGGGVIMMPAFTSVLRVPIKEAVASSLVAVAVFSVPALVTHTLLGHINWAFALLLTIGVVPGAQVGSRFTLAASEGTIRTLFGTFLVVLAVVYGATELLALR